ncbi:hypothetical protein HAX54_025634 [Datura stramonium]|uniref:Uncharacterized protein n=1 Tax=Datura stramonium TaxID=4076 RepID=A0ABS8V263_DATST|nr:hypothetical protein [Datura stramonium]
MELIRPLFPTPNNLRCFELSYLDQMTIPVFTPFALFYPPSPHSEGGGSYSYEQARAVNSSKLLVLKKSLSEILARFYPFAGRIKGNSVECNDDGVPFYEAFAHNYQFEDIHRKLEVVKHFLPVASHEDDPSTLFHDAAFCPLLVQVTTFECGGMTIGMYASHKVVDGATLYTLVNTWAVAARRSSPDCVVPELVAAAKFLPPPIPYVPQEPNNKWMAEIIKFFYNEQRVTKLFAFDVSTIASLKAKAVSDDVPVPTRTDVLSAVIWKCFMVASGIERRSTRLTHSVNIRKRFVPPLPDHCVGNAVAVSTTCKGENDGTDLRTLVTCIRKSLLELCSKYVDKQSRDEAILAIHNDCIDLTEVLLRGETTLNISSLCGSQFYVDFGWGKPSWLSVNQTTGRNFVLLMDSRDGGGIDALVCLKDSNTMSVFEHELELELLAFGSSK